MCSVDPDEIVEMTRAAGELDISCGTIMCRKCGMEKAVVVLRLKDPYCRECFLSYFVHKFRSTIGKSKQIRPGDRILIATSGGASSSALLHLVRDGLNETSHKKLRFEPAFLYIDESCLSDNAEAGLEFIHQVCSNVVSLDFPCYFTSLEQIMSPDPAPPTLYAKDCQPISDANSNLKEEIKQLIDACKTESAQQDLNEQLRKELIYACADALGYQKIFLADNATSLSICILANVALGRGSQLADRVQFKARHKDIEVYRPIREILQNEITYYVDLQKVPSVQSPCLKLKGISITSCTQEFVMGLQKEFPATIPTIFRTGDKLISTSVDASKCSTPDLNNYLDNEGAICAVCGSQLDTIQSESSAMHATVISQKLSRMAVLAEPSTESSKVNSNSQSIPAVTDNTSSLQNCDVNAKSDISNTCCGKNTSTKIVSEAYSCSQQSGCCNSKKSVHAENSDSDKLIPKKTMEQYLCYGCRIIVRELTEVGHLPMKIRGCVAEQERRKQMREQIQDYLL